MIRATSVNTGAFCSFCETTVDDGRKSCIIHEKWAFGINKKSEDYGDSLNVAAGDIVHVKCRADYLKCAPSNLQTNAPSTSASSVRTRSSTGGFDFRKNCFLCGLSVTEREHNYGSICKVLCKEKEIDKAMLQVCKNRRDDAWAVEVKGRISSVNDLRAEDAMYHRDCNTLFRMMRPPVNSDETGSRKRGRPVDIDKDRAFANICEYLRENDEEQNTQSELATMMKGMLQNEDSVEYTTKWLQTRLLKTFQDEIIVTFVEKASKIIKDCKDRNVAQDDQHENNKLTRGRRGEVTEGKVTYHRSCSKNIS